jgi:hypothetical protein
MRAAKAKVRCGDVHGAARPLAEVGFVELGHVAVD